MNPAISGINIVAFVICFILLAHMFSVNTPNVNKLNELERKINKLKLMQFEKSLPTKLDQAGRESELIKQNQLKDEQVEQLALNGESSRPQIQQMINQIVQQYLQKEAENKKVQWIYTNVNQLAKMLKLNDAQKDEF